MNIDFADRLAQMWVLSRNQAGKSQEYMAKALGVSRKTIQNWESGIGSPNFRTSVEWFEILGVPLYPYLMSLLYPNEIEGITSDTDMHELRKALHTYIDELDDLHVRELLFLLYGAHGSSPTGTLDTITAYLHLPLTSRISICKTVVGNYELLNEIGLTTSNDHVMPDINTLNRYIETATQAVIAGKETYTITQKDF